MLSCAQADSILNPEEVHEGHKVGLCTPDDVNKTFTEIQKWAEPADSKVYRSSLLFSRILIQIAESRILI